MRDHATRRPIPVEQSIHWKPLHDSHYIIASLQAGDGGRRKIFVRDQLLSRVEALVRASHGRRVFGLLIGEQCSCPDTGADYLVIESLVELAPAADDEGVAAALASALGAYRSDRRKQVAGWYSGAARVEARPSPITAYIHTSYFAEPWQTALVMGEGLGTGGAFFLDDTVNTRWFYAPFYELTDQSPTPNQPKLTHVRWPQYMTVDPVVLAPSEPVADLAPSEKPAVAPREKWYALRRDSAPRQNGVDTPPPHASAGSAARTSEATAEAPSDRPAPLADRGGLADISDARRDNLREKLLARLSSGSSERTEIVDGIQSTSSTPDAADTAPQVSDSEDTTAGDSVTRFVKLARAEGFFLAARFEATAETEHRESLWILNEPYSGMLLAVAAAGEEVIDASLHYNLHTDDAGLLRTPFPEHRDPDSRTVYVRETCIDALRQRCRQLRATNALVREWKVSPAISFLTPGEWQTVTASSGVARHGPTLVTELNDSRIADLPEGVRSQFHLSRAVDTQP
jgi:hypothetical protein